ncbi:uncharacterized protein LOC125681790 [Ostrea edulis]|uniref:uncharacterized protein LOC125681790 n=1 Tax=Ostrea edulis TaxID=37623 RepID=UPI002094821E|nr:uncharacterized protein LOC125681790 [Ostrea edulis]
MIEMGCIQSRIFPDVYKDKDQTPTNNPNILRGDVSLKFEAKVKREKSLHDKMVNKTFAAEEMSGKIMEEKERLSLGTRSRATSGTSSPVPNNSIRKQVHFKTDVNGDGPKSKKGGKAKSSKNHNGSDEKQITVTIAGVHSNQSNDNTKLEQPIQIDNSDDSNSSLRKDNLTTIEERTSSRASGHSISESKRG